MNETKHSPGPWVVDFITGVPTEGPFIFDKDGVVLGTLYGHNPNDGTLIKAAPELLAACKNLLEMIIVLTDGSLDQSVLKWDQCKSAALAINKAEGLE